MASETNEKLLGPLRIRKPLFIFDLSSIVIIQNIRLLARRVGNGEALHESRKKGTLHRIKRRKTNSIGHIFRSNCLLKHVIEEKTEGKMRKKT
jgi:hypothetical protein